MLIIKSNGSKWFGESPDSIDRLIEVLNTHTLNPTFEDYGNFIIKNLIKCKRDSDGYLISSGKPCYPEQDVTSFFGNFYDVSHVFNIDTDDVEIIERLTKAIRDNQSTDAYKAARKVIT